MSTMIQIRNVPDGLHRRLKARAAMVGMSLSNYLLGELRRVADRPTLEELRAPGASPSGQAVGVAGKGGPRRARQPVIVVDASAALEVRLAHPGRGGRGRAAFRS